MAQGRAEAWWRDHIPGGRLPADIDEAVLAAEAARLPGYLYIQKEGKYERIVSRGFEEIAA